MKSVLQNVIVTLRYIWKVVSRRNSKLFMTFYEALKVDLVWNTEKMN